VSVQGTRRTAARRANRFGERPATTTVVMEQPDGTFVTWAGPGVTVGVDYVEDCPEHAQAAAMFALKRKSGHDECSPRCWRRREAETHTGQGTTIAVARSGPHHEDDGVPGCAEWERRNILFRCSSPRCYRIIRSDRVWSPVSGVALSKHVADVRRLVSGRPSARQPIHSSSRQSNADRPRVARYCPIADASLGACAKARRTPLPTR
jgi:hypothetical protein